MTTLPILGPVQPVHSTRYRVGGTRRNRIKTLHTTEGGESRDSAEALSRFVATPRTATNAASYNSVNDADTIRTLVSASDTPFHCGGLNSSYGHCITGKAGQTREQWADEMSAPAVELAARFCAGGVQDVNDIRWLTHPQLAAFEPGFCDHNDIRIVFGGTTHTDVGPWFPRDRFLDICLDEFRMVHGLPPYDGSGGGEDMPYLVRDSADTGKVYERLPGGTYQNIAGSDYYDGQGQTPGDLENLPIRNLANLRAQGKVIG